MSGMNQRFVFVVGAAVALLAIAQPAFAHVNVSPKEAAKGGGVNLIFTVPNESETASTTRVEIFMPPEVKLTAVAPEAPAGWTVTEETANNSVLFAGGTISGEDEQVFRIGIEPLPTTVDQLAFKTLQSYSDGTVVRWIETAPPGGAEAEHPVPVMKLTGTVAPTTSSVAVTAAPTTLAAQPEPADEDDSLPVGGVIAVGAVVALGVVGFVVRNRRT